MKLLLAATLVGLFVFTATPSYALTAKEAYSISKESNLHYYRTIRKRIDLQIQERASNGFLNLSYCDSDLSVTRNLKLVQFSLINDGFTVMDNLALKKDLDTMIKKVVPGYFESKDRKPASSSDQENREKPMVKKLVQMYEEESSKPTCINVLWKEDVEYKSPR